MSKFHKNLTVLEGVDPNVDPRSIDQSNYVFLFTHVMSHATSDRLKRKIADRPHSYLADKRDFETIKRVMTNVLQRYWHLSSV